MHSNNRRASLDQASRLREMASPPARPMPAGDDRRQPHDLKGEMVAKLGPRVILISELPTIQGGFLLAWQLAQRLSSPTQRAAIIDLAPSSSRLPDQLARLHEPQCAVALSAKQPLWSNSPHGRGLAAWQIGAPSAVDLIAQPAGPYPSAEQMPRICEQLLRSIGGSRRPSEGSTSRGSTPLWNTLIILSDAQCVPLDSALWQAADEIILLLPESQSIQEQAQAALSARLPTPASSQRVLALWKQSFSLKNWRASRTQLNSIRSPQQLRRLENFQLPWPRESCFTSEARLLGCQTLKRAARLIINELERIKL